MEFVTDCFCHKKYHFINKGYEKIAKPSSEKRIDFSDTKLDFNNNNLIFECPECHNNIVIKLNEEEKALYIIYTSILTVNENINIDVNYTLSNIKKEIYDYNNQILKKSLNELKHLQILNIINNSSNVDITPDIYLESVNLILNSIEAE